MNEPSRLHAQLRALPEPELPDAVWLRLESRQRQRKRRRNAGLGIATFAIALFMALPLLSPDLTTPGQGPVSELAGQQRAPHVPDVHAELRAIDHALQVAYDRGASDAEIAPMWVARNELLANSRPAHLTTKNNRT